MNQAQAAETEPRTIGIDAALAETGWAVIDAAEHLLAYGVITRRAFVEMLERNLKSYATATVAIERTDWINGSEMGREAKARGALGIGLAAAYLACDDLNITPRVLGVREWMNSFNSRSKSDTARMVAQLYPEKFYAEQRTSRLRRNKQGQLTGALIGKTILKTIDGESVPSHVSDAIAIALVAQRLKEFERKVTSA